MTESEKKSRSDVEAARKYKKYHEMDKEKKNELLHKDRQNKIHLRQNESVMQYKDRTDKDAARKRAEREEEDEEKRKTRLFKDSERKTARRSEESPESTHFRKLEDATRHFEQRAAETEKQSQKRRSKQKLRQEQLRSKESADDQRLRQHADAERKMFRREVMSSDSDGDWNSWLDKDRDRHRESRLNETDEKKKIRKEKDAEYQKNKRANESHQERWERQTQDSKYQHRKRWDDRNDWQTKAAERHFQRFGNRPLREVLLDPLREAGSYFIYLLKAVRYNLKLPSSSHSWQRDSLRGANRTPHDDAEKAEKIIKQCESNPTEDWKWIQNNISKEFLMASQFEILSKKFAVFFNQIGIGKNDVVHFIVSDHIYTLPAIGGLWTIGAIGSLTNSYRWTGRYTEGKSYITEVELDPKVFEKQVCSLFIK